MIQGTDIVQQVSFQARDIVYILGGFATFFGLIITGFLKLQADARRTMQELLNGQSKQRHEDLVEQLKEMKAEDRRLAEVQQLIAHSLENSAKIQSETLEIIRAHQSEHDREKWQGEERRRRKDGS